MEPLIESSLWTLQHQREKKVNQNDHSFWIWNAARIVSDLEPEGSLLKGLS